MATYQSDDYLQRRFESIQRSLTAIEEQFPTTPSSVGRLDLLMACNRMGKSLYMLDAIPKIKATRPQPSQRKVRIKMRETSLMLPETRSVHENQIKILQDTFNAVDSDLHASLERMKSSRPMVERGRGRGQHILRESFRKLADDLETVINNIDSRLEPKARPSEPTAVPQPQAKSSRCFEPSKAQYPPARGLVHSGVLGQVNCMQKALPEKQVEAQILQEGSSVGVDRRSNNVLDKKNDTSFSANFQKEAGRDDMALSSPGGIWNPMSNAVTPDMVHFVWDAEDSLGHRSASEQPRFVEVPYDAVLRSSAINSIRNIIPCGNQKLIRLKHQIIRDPKDSTISAPSPLNMIVYLGALNESGCGLYNYTNETMSGMHKDEVLDAVAVWSTWAKSGKIVEIENEDRKDRTMKVARCLGLPKEFRDALNDVSRYQDDD